MSEKQTEEQRLADSLSEIDYCFASPDDCADAAAELRRLDEVNSDLVDALSELMLDVMVIQKEMREASERDPWWNGRAEIIQHRVDDAKAAITKAESAK